jgi:MraZ protein
MSVPSDFILGEFPRKLDERFRLVVPGELLTAFPGDEPHAMLAKERPGCLSLWPEDAWQTRMQAGVDVVQAKMRAGKLQGRLGEVQLLGRLLSTRHARVQLAARGRLLVPESFRPFLRVEPGGEVMVVGAAVCIELWHPASWLQYLEKRVARFGKLLEKLSQ